MDYFLQAWGGGCYLLNKALLARAEGGSNRRQLRIWGWGIYLAGLPAWVIILVMKRDWMAATIEAGGAPAMLLGLIITIQGLQQTPGSLEKLCKWFAYGLLAAGVLYSLYDYRGLTALSQLLEIGVMAGFLIGTWLLATKKASGWLWFMLMNTSMGVLMWTQYKPVLAGQQFLSLCFVVHGYWRSKKKDGSNGWGGL